MFYTDELRRLTPIAYIAVACFAFWAVMFFAWPFWTGVVIAVFFGILGSYLFGSWLRDLVRGRIRKNDELARREIQDSIDNARERTRRREE